MGITYTAGQIARISGSFTDLAGAAVDPASVALTLSGATTASLAYPGTIIKDSTGHYHYDLNTTGISGTVVYEWISTGTGATAAVGSFMVTGVTSFGLVTLAEMRSYLGLNPATADVDDSTMALAIQAATDLIVGDTNRTFEIQGAAADRYFTAQRPFSSNLVNLSYWYPWPAVYPSLFSSIVPSPMLNIDDFFLTGQTLNQITVTDVLQPTVTYTPTQTWPFNAASKGQPFTALVFAAGTFLPLGEGQCKVNAKFGYPVAIPGGVKNAALIQASRFFKRKDAPFGVAGTDAMGNAMRLQAKLDPDVEQMLTSYRRWYAAA